VAVCGTIEASGNFYRGGFDMKTVPSLVWRLAALGLGITLAGSALAAGSVQVTFTQPQNYTDIGFRTLDAEHNLATLTRHMASWGERLPDGQRLEIEVLDVDLAGEMRPWRSLWDVRVLTGRTDWPRMTLRWSLKSADQVLKSGNERLSDMSYLYTTARLRSSDHLAYDLRMLDDWLGKQVLADSTRR
jgi:Protein of unknown function (DUF3016)